MLKKYLLEVGFGISIDLGLTETASSVVARPESLIKPEQLSPSISIIITSEVVSFMGAGHIPNMVTDFFSD